MVGRHKSIAFFVSMGAGLIAFIILLYVGWVLLGWHTGILLFFGVLVLLMVIAGVVLNTIFLVREIKRNEQHDAFINAVTHELKTPVASIRLYLQTLQSREIDSAKQHEFYGIMLSDSDRLLSTIEQVLKTGRLGASDRIAVSTPVKLNALLEACASQARQLHRLEESSLRVAQGPEVIVRGDPEELRAAVSNLFDNAVKYSGNNVDILAEAKVENGAYAVIQVRDRGTGIPRHELKRIFKRFYRVPGPMATRTKGTGLGLYIVASVAKRHRGRAWAESDGLGRGATFKIELPFLK